MKFEPAPPNDFRQFIDAYFSHCRAACPQLLVIAGKWTFEDLIPGLSDFDTRFIAASGTSAQDWARISLAVGQVHTEMAREFPNWARNLEHLPGINLTIDEMLDDAVYYPEFQQWSFYDGDAAIIKKVSDYLAARPWSARDEAFHLRKFAAYFGPYRRGIDPPINIGKWESKYSLHSRYMHYFAPPVQSAVALARRQAMPGKLAAIREARDLFPNPQVIDRVLHSVERHYETPEDYLEPRLTEIERELEAYLSAAYAALDEHVTLIDVEAGDTAAQLSAKMRQMPSDPADQFREGVKFARLMKGRLLFYAESIPWFDSIWLIQNELRRIVANLYEKPLTAYALVRYGSRIEPEDVLNRLRGEFLNDNDYRDIKRFVATASEPLRDDSAKERARQVAEIFDPVQRLAESLSDDLKSRVTTEKAQR